MGDAGVGTGTRAPIARTLGRYQLLGEIASGGMASVHLGRMLGKGGFSRTVAVKVLHRHLASDPSFVAMFLDEARLSARIRHPNVVDVYDVDTLEGELIIVMEYVEGAALNVVLKAGRHHAPSVPLGFSVRVLHDALLGLHAAHELTDGRGELVGLVHRDVSPPNLLVGTDGVTRVSDFGVAKAAGRMASTGRNDVVKGKLRYLAPEQVGRGAIDRRVDVFAAGIVLWECLAGRALFDAPTEAEALAKVLSDPIPPPSRFSRDVPTSLDKVCLRALERDPARRFATAAEFAEALEASAGSHYARASEVGSHVTEVARASIELRRERMIADDDMPPAPALGALSATGLDDSPADSVAVRATEDSPAAVPSEPAPAPARPRSARRGAVLVAGLVLALGAGAFGSWLLFASPTRADPPGSGTNAAASALASALPAPAPAAPTASVTSAPAETPEDTAPAASDSAEPPSSNPRSSGGPPARHPAKKRPLYVPSDL